MNNFMIDKGYIFYLDGILVPITPSSITTKINNKNKVVTLINDGDFNILKEEGLKEFTFDMCLPAYKYPFARGVLLPINYYLNMLSFLKNSKKPFRFIVIREGAVGSSGYNTTILVSLENYEIKEDAGNGRDVVVSVTVKFSELMAKSFKVGGATTSEQTSGMYQLTQAMASGKLQGDEFRSIMENAPLLAQAISKYTGKSIGELKDMSKEGLITSDVIKNAVFAMSDEINTKFNSIPMTFGDVVTQIKSNAVNSFMSISSTMSGIFNSERFQGFIDGVSSFINKAFVMINWLIKGISMVGTVLYEIWGPIQPILVTVLGLLTAYKLVMGFIAVKTAIASGIATIYNLALLAKQTMLGAVSVALAQATAAQTGLNLAILTCPITWIIAGIALVIAAIYGVVAVFNKITGKAVSATGIIVGVFYWMGGMIYNIIAAAWNKLAQTFVSIYNLGVSIAEFFANVFKHPIRAVAHLFANFINFLIDKVKFLGSIIDTICGTNVVGKLETVQTAIGDWVNEKVGGNEITLKRMDATQVMMDRVGLKDMYNKGYEKGANFSLFGKNAETGIDTNTEFGNSTNPEVAKSNDLLKNIDKNTKKAGDMLDLSHDEISYLRDLAEREAINRFTTAEVKVDVGGITQHVASALDLDDIVDYMTNKMEEGIAIAAEGSYE